MVYLNFTEPICTLIVGRRRSGKTRLLIDIINNKTKDLVDIFIFSPNFDIDKTWEAIDKQVQKKITFWTSFDENMLKGIIDRQRALKEKNVDLKKKMPVLVIIDDFALKLRHSKLLDTYANNARHYGINVIFTTQKYNLASTVMRVGSTEKIFFNIDNEFEFKTIVD